MADPKNVITKADCDAALKLVKVAYKEFRSEAGLGNEVSAAILTQTYLATMDSTALLSAVCGVREELNQIKTALLEHKAKVT